MFEKKIIINKDNVVISNDPKTHLRHGDRAVKLHKKSTTPKIGEHVVVWSTLMFFDRAWSYQSAKEQTQNELTEHQSRYDFFGKSSQSVIRNIDKNHLKNCILASLSVKNSAEMCTRYN